MRGKAPVCVAEDGSEGVGVAAEGFSEEEGQPW